MLLTEVTASDAPFPQVDHTSMYNNHNIYVLHPTIVHLSPPVYICTGDTTLRVNAAVSYMLVTRRALPAPLINTPEVLSGRSWCSSTAACLLSAAMLQCVQTWRVWHPVPPCQQGRMQERKLM